jgi:hypothetical protein
MNRLGRLLIGLGLLYATTAAQTVSVGKIVGLVSDLDVATPVEKVSVRVRNTTSGATFETNSNSAGRYELAVPAGAYDLFLAKTSFAAVAKRDVVVRNGTTLTVDLTMSHNGNYQVPGETAFLLKGDRTAPLAGPAPRMADGKPDLSGVWLPSNNIDPDAPALTPWAAALTADRNVQFGKDDPRAHCLPSGVVRTNQNDLVKLVQTPKLLAILIEGSSPGYRQVFLDGRSHPKDFETSWMGHSVGTWQNDTLVIDTVGFNDKGWIDVTGRPQTEQTHVVERLRRTDVGQMELDITMDDPKVFLKPWHLHRVLKLAPDEELHEYVCNENERAEHLVGK